MRIGLGFSTIQRSQAGSRVTAWWPPRDLQPTGPCLHIPVQGMAVRTSLNAESERPETGPVLRLRARVVGAGPSGPGMAQQKPGAYCAALCAVLRAIRNQWRPMARLLSRVECFPSDLLTGSCHDGAPAPQLPSVKGNRFRPALSRALSRGIRIASPSFRALRLEAGISDLDVEAPRTAGHYRDSATDPLEPCNLPRFTRSDQSHDLAVAPPETARAASRSPAATVSPPPMSPS